MRSCNSGDIFSLKNLQIWLLQSLGQGRYTEWKIIEIMKRLHFQFKTIDLTNRLLLSVISSFQRSTNCVVTFTVKQVEERGWTASLKRLI